MKSVSEFLPLHTDFATGHTDGIRDWSTEAAARCLGQEVAEVHVEIFAQNGIRMNSTQNASLELQFASGDPISFHVGHGGEGYLLLAPLYPQTLDDNGLAANRISLSSTDPWSCLLGNRLIGIDLILAPARVTYQVSGFLFHFTSDITIGCENDGQDEPNLQFDPDWLQSTRTLAKWLQFSTG